MGFRVYDVGFRHIHNYTSTCSQGAASKRTVYGVQDVGFRYIHN